MAFSKLTIQMICIHKIQQMFATDWTCPLCITKPFIRLRWNLDRLDFREEDGLNFVAKKGK